MAGQGVVSDRAAMTKAVTGFDTAATSVKKAAQALEDELTADTKRYHGAQAAAFREVHMLLQEDLTTATKELGKMSSAVHESLTGYTTEDSEAADRMKRIQKKGGSNILRRLGGH